MERTEIRIYRNLMGENDRWAGKTRALCTEYGIAAWNLIGSPGSGKTELLVATLRALEGSGRYAVLEGDVETTRDAERIRETGVPVSQLLTDGACHLEAKLVHHAVRDLPYRELDALFVENVGNLVCPAEFDIGERGKIAVLSVTEGEDKAAKYPLLFREASAVVVTKSDLLPHVPFDMEAARRFIAEVHPRIPVFTVSALKGTGMDPWLAWLRGALRAEYDAGEADRA